MKVEVNVLLSSLWRLQILYKITLYNKYSKRPPPENKCHFIFQTQGGVKLRLPCTCRMWSCADSGQRDSDRVSGFWWDFHFQNVSANAQNEILWSVSLSRTLSVYQLIRILFVMGATIRLPDQPQQIPSGNKMFLPHWTEFPKKVIKYVIPLCICMCMWSKYLVYRILTFNF